MKYTGLIMTGLLVTGFSYAEVSEDTLKELGRRIHIDGVRDYEEGGRHHETQHLRVEFSCEEKGLEKSC